VIGRSSGSRLTGADAKPVEAAPQDPRDLHLADADALPDLPLREVALEAKAHHQPVARFSD
jgi:hypothetical protein